MAVLEGNAVRLTTCTIPSTPCFPHYLLSTTAQVSCRQPYQVPRLSIARFALRLSIPAFLGHGTLMIRLFIIWPGPQVPPHFSLQAFEWRWWFFPLSCSYLPKYFPFSGNDVLPQCMCNCIWTKWLRFIERLSCMCSLIWSPWRTEELAMTWNITPFIGWLSCGPSSSNTFSHK